MEEAASAGARVRFVLVRAGSESSVPRDALSRSGFDPREIHVLEPAVFDGLNDTESPQGVMAVVEMPEPSPPTVGSEDWYLVAHLVADPGNLGTLLRSAEASGVSGVFLTHGTVDPFAPKAVRSSAGAIFHVPVHFVADLSEISRLGVALIGTTSHGDAGATSAWSDPFEGCVGIVVGGEPRGLAASAPVNRWVRIPHSGRAESLNVAMAGTVLLFLAARQRGGRALTEGGIQPSSDPVPD